AARVAGWGGSGGAGRDHGGRSVAAETSLRDRGLAMVCDRPGADDWPDPGRRASDGRPLYVSVDCGAAGRGGVELPGGGGPAESARSGVGNRGGRSGAGVGDGDASSVELLARRRDALAVYVERYGSQLHGARQPGDGAGGRRTGGRSDHGIPRGGGAASVPGEPGYFVGRL